MVTLDEGTDGIVTLRFLPPYAEDDEPAYLAALERIGRRREPFGLVTLFAGGASCRGRASASRRSGLRGREPA